MKKYNQDQSTDVILIIAGGYDPRVRIYNFNILFIFYLILFI
jgi:hypothetical protein